MARPKGSGYDDRLILMVMAGQIVDGLHKNPWQAADSMACHVKGASHDATRRRLYSKYKKQGLALESKARKTTRIRSSLVDHQHPFMRAAESINNKWQSDEKKLDSLLKRDPELAQVVQDGRVGDLPLAELLPEILDRLAHRWIDFE